MLNDCVLNTKSVALIVGFHIFCVLANFSGIYIDNGIDQTVMHSVLDHKDKQEVEHEILDLLGLPERPKHEHGSISLRHSAPKFLLDVYKKLSENEIEIRSRTERSIDDKNFVTDLDRKEIEESDVIMTFLSKNHHVSEVRHEHGKRFWFDVSKVSKNLSLLNAELRIFQNSTRGKWQGTDRKYVVTIYLITTVDDETELEVLSTVNTTTEYYGWLELNITAAVYYWITNQKQNKGLYIGAHPVGKTEREVKLHHLGLVVSRNEDEYQPFMVAFFKGDEMIKILNPLRTKRHTLRHQRSEISNPFINEITSNCQIRTLYVDFRGLNWQDWIIKPDGYGAYYCTGQCHFPLNAHMNATNHAIVQALAHIVMPTVPKPCCAPTKYQPLTILYYTDDKSVNIQRYKDMIVKSCGCH